jgi:hypothetical protein
MTHISDRITGGSRKGFGTGPAARLQMFGLNFVPAALDRDGICASQTRSGAGDLLLNGAFVNTSKARAYLDPGLDSHGRCLGIYSAGNLSAITFRIYGWDRNGVRLVWSGIGPNATTLAVPKAFYIVERVWVSATLGTAAEVGSIDRFGLPMRVLQASQIVHVGWGTTLARDAGTFVAADVTSPAIAGGTDVRGTYAPSGAADGVKSLTITFWAHMTTRAGQQGIKQYGEGIL